MSGGVRFLSGENFSRKKLIIVSLVALIVVLSPVGVVAGVNSKKDDADGVALIRLSRAHGVAKSACSNTLYPELCYSSVADSLDHKVATAKDVIILSLNITIGVAKRNYVAIRELLSSGNKKITKREKTALKDCLETIDDALDELHEVAEDLEKYPGKKSIREHADDLKTLLSAAMTNQDTCLDGFSYSEADKHIREVVIDGQVLRVEKLCSNVLAMITNLTDTDIARESELNGGRKLLTAEGDDSWPEWLSAGDRKLLQSSTVKPDVVVAADGSGNYKTVAAAVAAAPTGSSKRFVIRIKAGVYKENVEVPKKKNNIMFVGDGRTTTIITGSRNVVDGSTTFHSATVAVVGSGFLARDITFQNTAGPSKHQAVALRVGSDLSAFYRCDVLAYQDTLYVHSNRQFFTDCFIAGTVDFIFGNAAALFQNCDIHARRPNSGQKNMVTAHGRSDKNQNTGIVIQNCRIGATSDLKPVQKNFPTYLGRPWKEYARTVIMKSTVSDVVHPAGWHEWSGSFALNTLFYAEHSNTGAGAGTSGRVKWKGYKVITSAAEAQEFTAARFIAGGSWLSATGFPFTLGL